MECRSSGGQHTIIFFFSNNITTAGASLDSATGNANGTPVIFANTVTVNLSGTVDAQQIGVTLQGVIDEFGQLIPDVTVPMKTLIGDTSGNGTVNGGINGTDISIVKLHSGTGISMPPPENDVALQAGK